MKRFAWWLFWFLMYAYLASTGELNHGGPWPWWGTPLGVYAIFWPLINPLVAGFLHPRRPKSDPWVN